MTFDPNDPFNHSSFNNHNQIKAGTDHHHYDSQRTRIDEDYARAAREQTLQITRNLDNDAMSITARLRKFFCGD